MQQTTPRVAPSHLVLAPLLGRPDSLRAAWVVETMLNLPRALHEHLGGTQVHLLPSLGTADVPGSRSALVREVIKMGKVMGCERTTPVLFLDDDIAPTPRLVTALLDLLEDQPHPVVAADYVPRGWDQGRPSTVWPKRLEGRGRFLVGAGCLMTTLGYLSSCAYMADGYLSTSRLEVVEGVPMWLADDYSMVLAMGGAVILQGVAPDHLATGLPSGSSSCDRVLTSARMGEPRVLPPPAPEEPSRDAP